MLLLLLLAKVKRTNLAKTEKTRGPRAVISLYYASALGVAGGDLGGAPSESRMRVAANNPRGAITLPFRVTFFFFFAFCLAFVFFLSPRSCRACRPGCLQVNCGADTLFERSSAERNKYYCPVARPERRPIRLRQCWEGESGEEGGKKYTHTLRGHHLEIAYTELVCVFYIKKKKSWRKNKCYWGD